MASTYRVYALRYGTSALADERLFLGSDRTCSQMDYFAWVAVDCATGEAVVIDTGFSRRAGQARGRTYLESPVTLMQQVLGIDAGKVDHLILTHLHYDHTGHLGDFPQARIYIQEDEVRFWTGPRAHKPRFRMLLEPDDLYTFLAANWEGRVAFLSGSYTVRDGITLHKVGGHTAGLQIVTIQGDEGWVVLAGDAAHYRIELEEDLIFHLVDSVADAYAALDTVRQLAGARGIIVPGHDPDVMARHPLVEGSTLVVRIA